jgi:hypothetical protein
MMIGEAIIAWGRWSKYKDGKCVANNSRLFPHGLDCDKDESIDLMGLDLRVTTTKGVPVR